MCALNVNETDVVVYFCELMCQVLMSCYEARKSKIPDKIK